jgi:hypothetical protein
MWADGKPIDPLPTQVDIFSGPKNVRSRLLTLKNARATLGAEEACCLSYKPVRPISFFLPPLICRSPGPCFKKAVSA